nr:hypothetical protein CFP56_34615 [Quercus suber]
MDRSREALIKWNMQEFGHIGKELATEQELLQALKARSVGMSNTLEVCKQKAEVNHLLDFEEQMWKQSETTNHVLLHCDFSLAVWAACGLVVDRGCAFVDLLWKLRNDSGPAGVNFTHFMAIAWNIWRNRNGVCHEEAPKSVQKLILEATQLVTKYQALQDCPISTNNTFPTNGVVLQDDKGRVAGALSQKIYAPVGPLGVKAKVMEAAVLFARDMGIQDIEFEGDSLQVCNFLRGCSSVPPDVANVLEGILSQLQSFRSFFFFSH